MSQEVWGDDDDPVWRSEPVQLTEMLLWMPPSWTRGLVVNHPPRKATVEFRLFQASMWRDYAMTWHGKLTRTTRVDRRWCEQIGRMTYEGCVRRARINVYLARRLNRCQRTDERAHSQQ